MPITLSGIPLRRPSRLLFAGLLAISIITLQPMPEDRYFRLEKTRQLAQNLFRQKRFSEAEKYYKKCLDLSRGLKGENISGDLTALADTFALQRKYLDSEDAYRTALELNIERFGGNSSQAIYSVGKLANLYTLNENFGRAKALRLQLLSLNRQVYGEDSIQYATSELQLGNLLQLTGEYVQAEKLLEHSLKIVQKKLGTRSLPYAVGMANLGTLYFEINRLDDAERLTIAALEIINKDYGENNRQTLAMMNNLATIHKEQQRYKEAEKLHRKVLSITVRLFGANSEKTAVSLNNLACLCEKKGNYTEAEQLYDRCLQVRESLNEKMLLATTLHNKASLKAHQGKLEEAIALEEKALATFRHVLDSKHPSIAISLRYLSAMQLQQKQYAAAVKNAQEALNITKNTFGARHRNTALVMMQLACALEGQGLRAEADALRKQLPN